MSKPDIFQQRALRTWHTDEMPAKYQRLHAILGLVGEAGELAEMVKKNEFKPDYTMDRELFVEELGDVLYYVAILAWQTGHTIEEISSLNAIKLQDGHGWKPDYTKLEM